MSRIVLFGGYAVILAVSTILAVFVLAQPPPGVSVDRLSSLLAGVSVGAAGCIFFRDLLSAVESRRTRVARHR